jgi:hypothetical protein
MSQITEIVKSALICPFTGHELIELNKSELSLINSKISEGLYFHHHGAPVNTKLKKAFICSKRSYIYPVFEDIVYLKKLTAIVPKNRTLAANKRVSKESAEAFYKEFGLGRKYKIEPNKNLQTQSNPLSLEQISDLGKLLPKSGNSFVSIVTHDLDSIHNLAFGRTFDHFLHIDFSIERLKSVVNDLKENTLYVLADMCNLPLKNDSVGALFSFDYINNYDKEVQKIAYGELKRAMANNGASVVLYERDKPLHAKGQLLTDQMTAKAMRFVAPWKKAKSSNIYFYPVGQNQTNDHHNFITKPSLRSQLS